MIPSVPKIQKPQWDSETLQAIHHAQADLEKAISSVRVLSEFFNASTYTDGQGNKQTLRSQWDWRAEEIQKHLSILWALEDGLSGRSGIAHYGGWIWPRGNARAYTEDELLTMRKARLMVEAV